MRPGRWAALGLLVGAGCADVCERATAVATTFATRGAACEVGSSALAFDVPACQASLSRCTAGDLAAVARYEDCVEALPTCTPETKAAFTLALSACATPMAGVTRGCFSP